MVLAICEAAYRMIFITKNNHLARELITVAMSCVLGIFISITPLYAGGSGGSASINQPDSLTRTDKLIIKWRDSSPARRIVGVRSVQKISERVQALGVTAGIAGMTHAREMSGGAHVLKLSGMVSLAEAQQIADRLRQDPNVEYVEPDRMLYPMLSPNDTYYNLQWHYHASASEVGAVNLPAAWDITTGHADIVVAVIDTGVLVGHSDLTGRTVAGYDFVTDVLTANDGNGRDPDASDPGDWVTGGERNQVGGFFYGCTQTNSTWHGTHVAGTVGAVSNNNSGVAGVNWVSKILPVRVLGKCGGMLSDIIDGMRWAAGLSVSGVPANPNPADVLNLSMGGAFSCTVAYQNAIDEIVAAGKVIVVAAGNESDDAANHSPASCNNVIAVAANTRAGGKAVYSNFGTVVDIAAPGGSDPLNPDGIASTLDSGATTPLYDSIYVYYQGTSMATPHVAGIASLMLSANYALTGTTISPALTMQKIQAMARTFPTGTGSDCTTLTCGSGIINAAAAVQAVSTPPTADAGIDQTVNANDPVTLDGSASTDDGTINSYAWTQTAGATVTLNNSNTTAPSFTAPNMANIMTFQLTVTDDVGIVAIDTVDVTVNGTNSAPVAVNGSLTTNEDTSGNTALNATDINGNSLTYSIVTNGSKGTAVITNTTTGAYTYTPNANANGSDSFTFKANDGSVDSNAATITVTINAVNDAPVVTNGTLVTDEDVVINGVFSASDADGDSLTYSIVSNGSKGTAVIANASTGVYAYTPSAGVNGADSLSFKVNDGSVDSAIATVTVTINAVNTTQTITISTTTPASSGGGGALGLMTLFHGLIFMLLSHWRARRIVP